MPEGRFNMGLDQFIPDAGDVLMCDFTTGFIPPEMTKKRKVIVLSTRPRGYYPDTYIVVPVSKTPPSIVADCHSALHHRTGAVRSDSSRGDLQYFGNSIKEMGQQMGDFSLEFLNLTERNFGEQ